jgi:hypothetical protein
VSESPEHCWGPLRPKLMAMKRTLDLTGKALAGAGLTGIVLYVVGTATQRSWPVWPYWIFGGMLIVGGALYFAGQRRPAHDVGAVDAEAAEDIVHTRPGPAFTGRWRYTLNGVVAPSLMMMTHKDFSHPGYTRWRGQAPPMCASACWWPAILWGFHRTRQPSANPSSAFFTGRRCGTCSVA